MNQHLKISIIVGAIAILLFALLIEVNAQGGTNRAIRNINRNKNRYQIHQK